MPQVTLYKNDSDKRELNKKIYKIAEVNCTFNTDNVSIISPELLLAYTPSYIGDRANYCYIPEWGRYYYINDITVNTGGTCTLYCDVDVLMSWGTYIRQIRTTITRQEYINSPMFVDSEYMTRIDRNINRYAIGDVKKTSAYYITVNGGGQENNE